MELFIIVFGAMVLLILAMSVGVIFSNKPIKGSCGGMSALGMEVACEICGGDKNKCEKEEGNLDEEIEGVEQLAYDATRSVKN